MTLNSSKKLSGDCFWKTNFQIANRELKWKQIQTDAENKV